VTTETQDQPVARELTPARKLASIIGDDPARAAINAGFRALAHVKDELLHRGIADYVATVAILAYVELGQPTVVTMAAEQFDELAATLDVPDPAPVLEAAAARRAQTDWPWPEGAVLLAPIGNVFLHLGDGRWLRTGFPGEWSTEEVLTLCSIGGGATRMVPAKTTESVETSSTATPEDGQ
jgi:hypothetical protein